MSLDQELQAIEQDAGVVAVFLSTHDDYRAAGELVKRCKAAEKTISEKYRDAKAQAHAAHKRVVDLERSDLDRVAPIRKELQRLRAEFKEREDADARAKAEQAIVKAPLPEVEGISMVEVWQAEVIDPDAVPREYCCPNEREIARVVRMTKGKIKIPGVRVYSEIQERVRT